jgi:hypothetical protein
MSISKPDEESFGMDRSQALVRGQGDSSTVPRLQYADVLPDGTGIPF